MEDSHTFALKVISATSMEENSIRQAFKEVSIMKRISTLDDIGHDFQMPWIVKLEDFWVEEGSTSEPNAGIKVSMVLELVSGPSLEMYLERLSHPRMKKRTTGGFSKIRPGEELSDDDDQIIEVTSDRVYDWMSQVILALSLLHKLGVVHRDIKPANLILSRDFKDIKVADFSISRVIQPGDSSIDTSAGTLNYSAPEVLQGKAYGESCDLWSLGCVLYEIMTLQKAFKIANTSKILSTISRREIPTVSDDCEPGLVMLCNRLMNPDPNTRPSALSLCKHPRLKPFIVKQLSRVHRRTGRSSVVEFLSLESIVPIQGSLYDQTEGMRGQPKDYSLVMIDEREPGDRGSIEDQFDDDIGYEILVLLQGTWLLANSNRRVQVDVEGQVFTFSDGRAPYEISRAWRGGGTGPVEWMLGKDIVLVKSLSSFMSPQKLFFSKIQGDIPKRLSDLNQVCLVMVRDDPLATVYLSSASTASS